MEKYLIGVLYYGAVDREHDRCMQVAKQHPLIEDVFTMSGCPYIDIGRSAIASYAKDRGLSLLFIDHDMLFDPEAITQIIESCEATKGVVGAGYSMRRAGVQMIGGIDTRKVPEGQTVTFFKGGGVFEAVYLGMGFTAIHHEALSRMVEHFTQERILAERRVQELETLVAGNSEALALVAQLELPPNAMHRIKSGITDIEMHPFFALLQAEGNYYGEDVSFCIRAKLAGVGVYMDTRVRVYHKGTYCYGLEDCGFVVPYLESMQAVLSEGGPAPKPAAFTPHDEIAKAMIEAGADEHLPFPLSVDPTKSSVAA